MKPELTIKEFLLLCDNDLALPNFQRDYVWDKKDVTTFLDSIYKNWPTGLIIIWKTRTRGRHLGSLWVNPRENRNPKGLILDGQQRLTTLKALKESGSLPLKSEHGNREPHYFYFDNEEHKFISDTERKKDNIRFVDVIDILRENNEVPNKLLKINQYRLPVKCINSKDNQEAIEIFNRVNTSGKKIDNVVIAFARIKDRYPEISSQIIDFQKECMRIGFDISDRILMNSFIVVNNIRNNEWSPGTRKPDKRIEEYLISSTISEIRRDWEKTFSRVIDALKFLRFKAGYDSDQFLTADNIIVTLTGYYEVNDLGRSISMRRRNILLRWLYRTILYGRYSVTSEFINDLNDLFDYGRFVEVNRRPRGEYSKEGIISIMYSIGILNNMKDYTGNQITWLNSRQNSMRIHVDHIYPRSKMLSKPISTLVEMDIHEDFGNKAFIMGRENMSKNKRFPGECIERKNIGQWINPYENFLTEEDYNAMKKSEYLLKKYCREIQHFIRERHDKIIRDIRREIV
jgi:hypothetical protein